MSSKEKYESMTNELEDRRIEKVARTRLATLDEATTISHADMALNLEWRQTSA
jgi:hypothetical protein